ncbi:hypothetical protein GCM10020295_15700 [Streptomyces cinereospinus]|uniref:AIM24 family protein n=1 Tax=Streptomyces cinereospinus TaxID=285561 RepID=UPI00338459FC
MTLRHEIVGNATQLVVVTLRPGQTVYCEAGTFRFKTTNVTMETRLSAPSGGGAAPGRPKGAAAAGIGGLPRPALGTAVQTGRRAPADESPAFQYLTAQDGEGTAGFAGVLPGELRALELDGTRAWCAQRNAVVAAESTVGFALLDLRGGRTGTAGGEGVALGRLTGRGTVIIAGAGTFVDLNPADFGGRVEVDAGSLVAFEESVGYGVRRAGGPDRPSLMHAVSGGEGVALATLEGDGSVLLQSTTVQGLATALNRTQGGDRQGPASGFSPTPAG